MFVHVGKPEVYARRRGLNSDNLAAQTQLEDLCLARNFLRGEVISVRG